QALLALRVLAEADDARDFREDRRFLRLARLEQVGDTRQAAGDVARLRGLLRDTRDDVADADFRAVLQRDDRAGRQEVLRRYVRARELELLALLVLEAHGRTQILRLRAAALRIGDDVALQTGQLVGLLLHRDAVDEVDEAHATGHFRDDRMGVRIPRRDD